MMPALARTGQDVAVYPAYPGQEGPGQWQVEVRQSSANGVRTFELQSTSPQRGNGPSARTIVEAKGDPQVNTGSPLFDALFAQAVAEARADSVEAIRDRGYGDGPIDCRCFETGEQWHYVWTRDLSYALDLGLAGFDPERSINSLVFKTSPFRPGTALPDGISADDVQIVQDTGSGGSWPVSTDRTTWALGAERTLASLEGTERSAFAAKAFAALKGTLETDRIAAFDARSGLYGGEHSFLDWREQTYPGWVTDNLSAMAQSKALSTNITQYRAMTLAARLAQEGGNSTDAERYGGWAQSLAQAINTAFWDADAGLYATYLSADLQPRRIEKYDLLGNALAIVSGLADPARSRTILSRYPFAPFGPPVVWPQAPGEFVYHNRAQWPFVTAYALRAAASAGHVAAADRAADALMRGAAINLSNMENLEWLTGLSQYDDGPRVNSRRQLWSVGGYYGFVTGVVFGWSPELDGVHIRPFLTSAMRTRMGSGAKARLEGLNYAGHKLRIDLALPPEAPAGALYDVTSIRLNGSPLSGPITEAMLKSGTNVVAVTFGPARAVSDDVTLAPTVPAMSHDDRRVFMPQTPAIAGAARSAAGVRVTLAAGAPADARFLLYRDGRPLAAQAQDGAFIDASPLPAEMTACYSLVAVDLTTGMPSQPSEPFCLRGTAAQTIVPGDPRLVSDAERSVANDRTPTIKLALGNRLEVRDIVVPAAGRYAISLRYDNHAFSHNTGVTNAVKQLAIAADGGAEQTAIIQMPHILQKEGEQPFRTSTIAVFDLQAGRHRIRISEFFNMSNLLSNSTYNGPGGKDGPLNAAEVAALNIDRVSP